MNLLDSNVSHARRLAALLNPQPIGNFSGTKMYTLKSKIDHYYTRADQLIGREA